MKINLRERLTRYQCFIRPKVNFALEFSFKGLVHPKMKILWLFTHPQVVPNLYVFICSAVYKGRYLEECFNQTDLNPHWLPQYVFFFFYGSQWGLRSVWLKHSSIVFSRTIKHIEVWNDLRVSKWWKNFYFWVNYPFECVLKNTCKE